MTSRGRTTRKRPASRGRAPGRPDGSSDAGGQDDPGSSVATGMPVKRANRALVGTQLGRRRLGPVSYTHLDVYKRQKVARERGWEVMQFTKPVRLRDRVSVPSWSMTATAAGITAAASVGALVAWRLARRPQG